MEIIFFWGFFIVGSTCTRNIPHSVVICQIRGKQESTWFYLIKTNCSPSILSLLDLPPKIPHSDRVVNDGIFSIKEGENWEGMRLEVSVLLIVLGVFIVAFFVSHKHQVFVVVEQVYSVYIMRSHLSVDSLGWVVSLFIHSFILSFFCGILMERKRSDLDVFGGAGILMSLWQWLFFLS